MKNFVKKLFVDPSCQQPATPAGPASAVSGDASACGLDTQATARRPDVASLALSLQAPCSILRVYR
jgi:hypothetical protein